MPSWSITDKYGRSKDSGTSPPPPPPPLNFSRDLAAGILIGGAGDWDFTSGALEYSGGSTAGVLVGGAGTWSATGYLARDLAAGVLVGGAGDWEFSGPRVVEITSGILIGGAGDWEHSLGPGPLTILTGVPFPEDNHEGAWIADSDTQASFSIFDANLPEAEEITCRLTITNGAGISLATTTGLSFAEGDGTNDAEMEFSGLYAAINAALDPITIHPNGITNTAGDFQFLANDNFGNSDSYERSVQFATDFAREVTSGVMMGGAGTWSATSYLSRDLAAGVLMGGAGDWTGPPPPASFEEFTTPGFHTFTATETGTHLFRLYGGGQRGYDGDPSFGGGGGEGADYADYTMFLNATDTVNIMVGAGGTMSAGAAGEDTKIGSDPMFMPPTALAAGGNSGSTSIGDTTHTGGGGGSSLMGSGAGGGGSSASATSNGTAGGNASGSTGGAGGTIAGGGSGGKGGDGGFNHGDPGSQPGGGGGGGGAGMPGGSGGNGATGKVRVEW